MRYYKPNIALLIIDIVSMLFVFGIVLGWFPLTAQAPFIKYSNFLILFVAFWLLYSYLCKRYKKRHSLFESTLKLFYAALCVYVSLFLLINFFYDGIFSRQVLLVLVLGVFAAEYVIRLIYDAYRYAVNYEVPEEVINNAPRKHADLIPSPPATDGQYQALASAVQHFSGKKTFDFLNATVDLRSRNLRVLFTNSIKEITPIANYHYSVFIQLEKLNNIRGVNVLLYQLNHKLSNDGIFICCFESKSTRKKTILKRYPKLLNYIVYALNFFIKRVIPRILLTQRLYYDITRGKNRIFSKAEVFGRLYYSGFEIIADKKIDNLNYVVARRIADPRPLKRRTYGLLIRLPRIGKNGKRFNVYKMRTMHPYSEYLQPYIFEKNNLQEGGKIRHDIRVTTMGRLARKYWIDEFPMIVNIIKGNIKLVGVRPLSPHFFSLYTKELQEERIKFKPGLLPPFYADMPKTLDEIQESEMLYLKACEKDGVFVTDIRYLFKILNNIFLKKARSA